MPHLRTTLLLLALYAPGAGAAQPFYMGADVSLQPFMLQRGVNFNDNGVAKSPTQILYDRGANLFRIRLFVNPQTQYTNQNAGAIQTLAYDLALAQQIKAAAPNARLLLDLHYSDTWADPGKQTTPAAWAGQSLADLRTTVRTYTSETLNAFKNAGVMPDLVQVGNEIQSGMLWDAGKINFSGSTAQQRTSWQNFGGLVSAAIDGVRDAQGAGPKIDVAIHPGGYDVAEFFFSRLTSANYGSVPPSSFDILGVSYYPDTAGELNSLRQALTNVAGSYGKPVMVLETNAPWRSTFAPPSDPAYPDTPAGQLQFLTDLRDTVMSLPNQAGLGVVYWYPEAVQVPGFNIYNGGSTALFAPDGAALPAVGTFTVPEPSCITAMAVCLIARRASRSRRSAPNTVARRSVLGSAT